MRHGRFWKNTGRILLAGAAARRMGACMDCHAGRRAGVQCNFCHEER